LNEHPVGSDGLPRHSSILSLASPDEMSKEDKGTIKSTEQSEFFGFMIQVRLIRKDRFWCKPEKGAATRRWIQLSIKLGWKTKRRARGRQFAWQVRLNNWIATVF
jgi:hypothetical protein